MEELKSKVDEAKKPRMEMNGFGTKEMRGIDHALDILLGLEVEAVATDKTVALEKIRSARRYLEGAQRKLLEDPGLEQQGFEQQKSQEEIAQIFDLFMKETFLSWYGRDAEKAQISMQTIPLAEMNYKALKNADPSKFGEYTMNPETVGMNHQENTPKVKILDMREFVGKPKSEVVAYIVKTYGDKYHIPGIEYEKYLLDNPDKVPQELKDGNWYYFRL